MSQYKLAERAVLMRISLGLPGQERKDKRVTDDVQRDRNLGSKSGKWIKALYPDEALDPIKQIDTAARAFHEAVTLVWDKGIGILPGALVMEYSERMKAFASKRQSLIENHFFAKAERWIEWARVEHNGTFDPSLYPGCTADSFDPAAFKAEMMEKFTFRTEPLPVPDAGHFESTIASLLGTDAESVNIRVADAMQEGMRELMRRLIEPVKHMATKLAEQPKIGKDGTPKEDICFRDSLIGNIREIAALAPKLNISGDPAIDQFASQMSKLASVDPEKLREDKSVRSMKAAAAADLLKRLEGYRI